MSITCKYKNIGDDTLVRVDGGRSYYAVSWHYGCGCTTGEHGNVHAAVQPRAFATAAERNEWVEGGSSYRSEAGYREAVTLSTLPYGWSKAKFVQEARM